MSSSGGKMEVMIFPLGRTDLLTLLKEPLCLSSNVGLTLRSPSLSKARYRNRLYQKKIASIQAFGRNVLTKQKCGTLCLETLNYN